MENFNRIDRHMVVEHNLVDRYLMGQLSEEQAMAFEDFFAGCPETMAELDLSERMIKHIRASDRSDAVAEVTALSTARAERAEKQGRLKRLLTNPVYSAAASFVAVAALAAVTIGQTVPDGAPLGAGNVPVAYLEPTRGSDEGLIVERGEGHQLHLMLDLGMVDDDRYEARILDGNGDLISAIDDLSITADALSILLQGAATAPGDYRINVRNTAGETWVFPYTIAD